MSALSIQIPYPIFSDRDGQPLENGYVWIGQPYVDPQTNPVQVYLDDALSIPVAQPLRTIGGYVSNSGTPAQLYIDGVNFSIRVQDNKGTQVYYFPDGSGINPDAAGVTYNPGPDSLLLPGGPISVKAALDEITDDGTNANGAALISFLQAGTSAVATTVQAKLRETVSVLDFGADPTGATDSTAEIQAAIDYAETISTTFSRGAEVLIPPGEYVTSAPLVIGANGVKLKGSGIISTVIRFTGSSGAAVQADGILRTACRVEGMTIRCDTSGGNGVDFTWFSYSDFENLAFDLRTTTQVGIYAKGNGLGSGPYYNTFDKIHIIGQPATAGQIGVQLAPATSGGFLADGPNSNLFSNFRRVASLDVGFDIQSGNANLGTNISLESIRNYGFAFNNRPADYTGTATSGAITSFTDSAAPFVTAGLGGGAWKIVGGTGAGESGDIRLSTTTTITFDLYTRTGVVLDNTSQYEVYKTKAQGNKFDNIRMEGANTSAVSRFYPGALNNKLSDIYPTSISTTQWVKDVAEGSNWCLLNSASQLVAVPMWIEGGLTAGSTLGLHPNTTTLIGSGFRILPRGGVIVGISVSCDSLSGVVGSATLRYYKTNIAHTDLDVTLNANTLYGNMSYLQTFTVTSGFRIENQHDIDLRLITDGSWSGTTKQISALLWVSV